MNDKTKVLYVFCSSNYSGAEIVISRLIESNTLVKAIVLCPKGEFSDLIRNNGTETIIEDSLESLNRSKNKRSKFLLFFVVGYKFLKINLHLLFILWRRKIKVVHANNLVAAVYISPSVLLLKIMKPKIKFVWSNHDLTYVDGEKMEKVAARCVTYFDTTFAVSFSVKKKFAEELQQKIEVLYNGIDLRKFAFSESLRKTFRENNNIKNEIVFAIVGLIIHRKGHLLLIEAFNNILKNNKNIKLIIIGKFLPNEYEYERAVLNSVNSRDIILMKHTDNIHELYSGIDVLINASLPEMSEPLGTTIYEAMAYKRIVIASDTGGSPEIINDKINGFLFEAGKVAALENVLTEVLGNWQNLDEVRENARKLVEQKFDVYKMAGSYNSIIDNI